MEPTQTRALQSEAILWWPWSMEEYVTTATRFNEVAEHEGISVEVVPFGATPPEGYSSFLPDCYGLLIRVWAVNAAASDDLEDSTEDSTEDDDVLSGFKTRRCDDDADQHDEEEEEVCCICLDDLYRGSVTSLDCRHEFHSGCIRRWLVRGENFCPLCKAPAIKQPLHSMLDSLSIN